MGGGRGGIGGRGWGEGGGGLRRNCNLYTRGLRRSEVEEEKGRRKRGGGELRRRMSRKTEEEEQEEEVD